MKRIFVLLAVLALMLGLFAGCGRSGVLDDGSNVSTTDNGVVNGTNPDGGYTGGMSGSNSGTAGGNGTAGSDSGSGTGMAAGAGNGTDSDAA